MTYLYELIIIITTINTCMRNNKNLDRAALHFISFLELIELFEIFFK